MHISVTSSGTFCKLSKTDIGRIAEVRRLCDAIRRHTDNKDLHALAECADEALAGVLTELDSSIRAGTTQQKAAS